MRIRFLDLEVVVHRPEGVIDIVVSRLEKAEEEGIVDGRTVGENHGVAALL